MTVYFLPKILFSQFFWKFLTRKGPVRIFLDEKKYTGKKISDVWSILWFVHDGETRPMTVQFSLKYKKNLTQNDFYQMVGLVGFEPTASCTPCMRATNCAIARKDPYARKALFLKKNKAAQSLLKGRGQCNMFIDTSSIAEQRVLRTFPLLP